MKALVVGGTGFLGGAIVEAAVAAGCAVAVLSRGETERTLPQGVRVLQGDRHGDLAVLIGERFDLVFDTCAYAPDAVERLLQVVGPGLRHYLFVSSVSVYRDYSKPRLSETDPVPTAGEADYALVRGLPAEQRSDAVAYAPSYGPLKRACEVVAQERLGERAILLRSGLLVGAGDTSDRLTWWVRRIDQGGRIPVPAAKDSFFQMIDVRDAAAFAVRAALDERSGIYNMTSRDMPLSALLDTIVAVTGAEAELVWLPAGKLEEAGIQPWTELPLIAPSDARRRYFFQIDTGRARRNGLTCRPIAETLTDLLHWDRANRDRPLKCRISPEQERALLA